MLPDLHLSPLVWLFTIAITCLAGFVKGVVGFAMPMVMVSGLGTALSPELALAAVILPTLISNVPQAFRNGLAASRDALLSHWRYVVVVSAFIVVSAQLVNILHPRTLYAAIGIPVTLFAIAELSGRRVRFQARHRRVMELGLGTVAGLIGGVSGIWGPPTVIYLTSLNTPKREQLQVQGIVFGFGSITLTSAHIGSGVLNAETVPFSAMLVVPALMGMAAGMYVSDRMDQERFRQATLVVLVVAGLNLIRRSAFG